MKSSSYVSGTEVNLFTEVTWFGSPLVKVILNKILPFTIQLFEKTFTFIECSSDSFPNTVFPSHSLRCAIL
jgi:hypothetical protein